MPRRPAAVGQLDEVVARLVRLGVGERLLDALAARHDGTRAPAAGSGRPSTGAPTSKSESRMPRATTSTVPTGSRCGGTSPPGLVRTVLPRRRPSTLARQSSQRSIARRPRPRGPARSAAATSSRTSAPARGSTRPTTAVIAVTVDRAPVDRRPDDRCPRRSTRTSAASVADRRERHRARRPGRGCAGSARAGSRRSRRRRAGPAGRARTGPNRRPTPTRSARRHDPVVVERLRRARPRPPPHGVGRAGRAARLIP